MKSVEGLWQDLERASIAVETVSASLVTSRFRDIPCAKATALQGLNGRYLHANRMGATLSERGLIASQYPFAEEFWAVAAQEGAAILDLTRPRDRMLPYYPREGETAVFGNLEVRCISTEGPLSEYQVLSSEPKTITRFHFSLWPDYGVISVEELSELVDKIESMGPLWVHCRAGVGRTGTLITAVILKEQIKRKIIGPENLGEKLVNVILRLRSERNRFFVQTEEQFRLLYDYARSLYQSQ